MAGLYSVPSLFVLVVAWASVEAAGERADESSGLGSSLPDLHGEGTILLVLAICLWSLIAFFLLAILLLLTVKFCCTKSGKRSAADGGEVSTLLEHREHAKEDGNKVSHYYLYIGPPNHKADSCNQTTKNVSSQTYGSVW